MLSLYGLTVTSELELPGLESADGRPELVIRWGSVRAQLDAPSVRGVCFQASPGRFVLQLDSVARFSVVGGREVTIDRAPGAQDDDIRTILLGAVLGAVLYQRGLVPFHASAVHTPRGAVLFGGRSGSGKSTLAAALARRGHDVLADDIAAVTITADGIPVVIPGPSQLWLWKDALSRLGIPAEPLGRVRPELEKHVWPSDRGPTSGPVPVVAYYHLERHNQLKVVLTPARGMERVRVLGNEIYRPTLSKGLADPVAVFGVTTALGRHSHVVRVRRPNQPFLLDELVNQVVSDLESVYPEPVGTPA